MNYDSIAYSVTGNSEVRITLHIASTRAAEVNIDQEAVECSNMSLIPLQEAWLQLRELFLLRAYFEDPLPETAG